MSFRDPPTMAAHLPAYMAAWTPKLPPPNYTRTSTCRDWSDFDAPSVTRMTARRVRIIQPIRSIAKAG